jgi:hypothetical protein
MTIQIFQNRQSLVEHLASNRTFPAVFDLSRSEKMWELHPEKILTPEPFSADQKEKILDEFIEIISELGELNCYSLPWLCHPISEKNDLLTDNLFKQVIDFLKFSSIFSTVKERPLVFFTENSALIQNIRDFLIEEEADFEIIGLDSEQRNLEPVVKRRGKYILLTVKRLLQAQGQFMSSRHLWKGINRKQSYSIIRTWFDSRSPSLMNKSEDVYFGILPHFLQSKGTNVLYFGECQDGFEHIAEVLMKNPEYPLLLQSSCIHGLDFLKAVLFRRSIKNKIQLKPGLKLLDHRVDCVFRNYFNSQSKSLQVETNFLIYSAVLKLMRKLRVDCFYMPFENYNWEKLTRMACRRVAENTMVISFQHSQVAMSSTKFFLGKNESRAPYLPDRIVTLGSVTRDILIGQKNYPEDLLRVGCALRNDPIIPDSPAPRKKSKKVLVQLWTFEKSIQLMNFILSLRDCLSDYDLAVSPHPCNPMKKIMPHLDYPEMTEITVADRPLSENFNTCDVVIYHGTTSCLDALAHGLPVVNIEFEDFISPDPLFDFSDFKWTVKQPDELVEVLGKIFELSDAEYYSRQKSGFDFARKYFWPVNERGLSQFIIS